MDTDRKRPKQIETLNLRNMMFQYYKKEVEIQTKEFARKNPDLSEVKLNLLQSSEDILEIGNKIFNIADFYNRNYTGNRDFIHIPNITDIFQNAMKYPILFATNGDYMYKDNLLGVTTIKFENNKKMTDNPDFPTVGENVLFISGILAKSHLDPQERIRGIGKLLFKSAIRGAYYISKNEKIRLICEADCRNNNSLNAISKAVKELNEEDIPVQLMLRGYYEILNKKNELKEAPTFILEIDLLGDKKIDCNSRIFSYLDCKEDNLLKDISRVVQNNTKELRQFVTKKENIIIYHEINPINALNIKLEIGDSAKGNKRIPIIDTNVKNTYQKVIKN